MRITHGIPGTPRRPLALTIGNFDGVHLGHRAMLGRVVEAARAGGVESCAMTFEPHPREFFTPGDAPARLSSLREKLEMLAALGLDRAHVCRFNAAFAGLSPADFVQRVLVDGLAVRYLLIGDDFRFGARRAGDFAFLRDSGERLGFRVDAMESVEVGGQRVSSTLVRQALAAGDISGAARLLGRPYSVSGRVVHGDKNGRKLGFPTANIEIRHNRPPLTGIFVVEVRGLGDAPLPGVASLGVRPTLKQDGRYLLEVHLFDFSREVYGAHLAVDFLARLRDEERYSDWETLRARIAADVEEARRWHAASRI